MTAADPVERLTARIAGRLTDGLEVSGDLLAVAATAFGEADPQHLATRLQDPSDSETGSLLELLLYPDDSLQMDLEEILAGCRLDVADLRRLERMLARDCPRAVLRLPDGGRFPVPFPPPVAENFVARLHLDVEIAPNLRAACRETGRPRVMIRIRNHGHDLPRAYSEFAARLIRGLGDGHAELPGCLDFVLSLPVEYPDEIDPARALLAKKRFFLRSLQRADQIERSEVSANYETRMMQGVRTPHVDRAAAVDGIARADQVARSVFGRALPVEAVPDVVRETRAGGRQGAAALLRRSLE